MPENHSKLTAEQAVAKALLSATYMELKPIVAGLYGYDDLYLKSNEITFEAETIMNWASSVEMPEDG